MRPRLTLPPLEFCRGTIPSTQPGAELGTALELIELADAGHEGRFICERSRGEISHLAVASAAHEDRIAADLMVRAGEELAGLAMALCQHISPRPIALAGRAARPDPAIGAGMRAALGRELPPE